MKGEWYKCGQFLYWNKKDTDSLRSLIYMENNEVKVLKRVKATSASVLKVYSPLKSGKHRGIISSR